MLQTVFLFDDFVVTGPNIPDGGPDKGQVPVSPKAHLTTNLGTHSIGNL